MATGRKRNASRNGGGKFNMTWNIENKKRFYIMLGAIVVLGAAWAFFTYGSPA